MKLLLVLVPLLAGAAASAANTAPVGRVSLASFAAFRPPAANWRLAGALAGDPARDKPLAATAGTGVAVCNPTKELRGDLFTAWTHGDLAVELEFLLPRGSNSGVYLQGRYEVQLFDSWGVRVPKASDCGGIYQRWDPTRGKGQEGFEGTAPRVNACRAPGLWQHLRIEFAAPRFDPNGRKTAPARFVKVTLNDVVVQENVAVSGPTRSAAFDDEQPLGPLMIQGDHGPVALRNITVLPPAAGVK